MWGPDGLVAEAWGGVADRRTGRAVDERTVFPVYSVTKAFTASALHLQVDRGLLAYEARVTDWWPEYGVNGKEATTVRDVLTHRAGLPVVPDGTTRQHQADWDWMTSRLAAMTPTYPPGTTNAYHPTTWGWLVGELVRRTDPAGRSFRDFVHEELFAPLGIDECWLGVPPEAEHRLAALWGRLRIGGGPLEEVTEDSYGVDHWQVPSPSGGAVTTARSAARFFAMLAGGGELDGVRVLSERSVLASLVPREDGRSPDATVGWTRWIGAGGYWLGGTAPPAEPMVATGRRVLWQPGAGGSLGWADLDRGCGVAICHSRLFEWERLDRSEHPFGAIADAVDALIGG